jgi:hypothetical protein
MYQSVKAKWEEDLERKDISACTYEPRNKPNLPLALSFFNFSNAGLLV